MDISNPQVRLDIAKRIGNEIDQWVIDEYSDGHRTHLGASLIGDDCSRKLWSTFRWLKEEKHPGWKMRLFQRGHREEAVFIEYLRAIGFTITDRDDDGKQARISDVGGHFGGSLDGILQFPPKWEIPGNFLAEFKTKGTGPAFVKLKEKGVAVTDTRHWGQMCTYGLKRGIEYAVYMTVNKNDDSLHVEFVKLDPGMGKDMIRKAEILITSQRPPAMISKSSTDFRCKNCNFHGICHEGEKVEINCRSCLHASPISDAKWTCARFGGPIPDEVIKTGCTTHVSIV